MVRDPLDEASDSSEEPSYEGSRTLAGMLKRGRGSGIWQARRDPAAAAAVVRELIAHDWRWDFIDDRDLYLARLVQGLELPLDPVVALLGGDEDDCERASGVLCRLALAGSVEARGALRDHVGDGRHWMDVLEDMARIWPVEWWDDLADVARARLDGERPYHGKSEPWVRWRDRIPVRPPAMKACRHALQIGAGTDRLLALLADPGETDHAKVNAIRALSERPPEPALVPLVPWLGTADGERSLPLLGRAVARLGALAVPAAREWAQDERPWLSWTGIQVLAERGEAQDVPVLTADLQKQWEQRCWCGPALIAEGLARHGTEATDAVPLLRKYWVCTPHSYERTAYLKALAAIDPAGLEPAYVESLWDCEPATRLLGIASAPDEPFVRKQIAALAADPMEEPEVREAAKARTADLS